MCTKHLETVSTIRNHFMFLQMVEKRTPTASQKQKQIGLKTLYFFEQISNTRDF